MLNLLKSLGPMLSSVTVPVSNPRPIGLYARIPMPSSRNVGTKSVCRGTRKAHTSEADLVCTCGLQLMLASLLPMHSARIWHVRNGQGAMGNEGSTRELPMRNQEKQPRGSTRRNSPEETGKKGNQEGDSGRPNGTVLWHRQ